MKIKLMFIVALSAAPVVHAMQPVAPAHTTPSTAHSVQPAAVPASHDESLLEKLEEGTLGLIHNVEGVVAAPAAKAEQIAMAPVYAVEEVIQKVEATGAELKAMLKELKDAVTHLHPLRDAQLIEHAATAKCFQVWGHIKATAAVAGIIAVLVVGFEVYSKVA